MMLPEDFEAHMAAIGEAYLHVHEMREGYQAVRRLPPIEWQDRAKDIRLAAARELGKAERALDQALTDYYTDKAGG